MRQEPNSNPANIPPQNIFLMYDIRGVVNDSLTNDGIYAIGQSFATVALERGVTEIIVGGDARLSTPELKNALIRGVISTGCNVADVGTVATPLVYFAANRSEFNTGMMVTASHNPPHYNGIKILLQGQSLYAEQVQELRARIIKGDFSKGSGQIIERMIETSYLDAICSDLQLQRPVRVVIDCANGIAGAVAPQILRSIGCEVIELFCDVDGTFPNHPADPTQPENLRDLIAAVRLEKADVGLALDGDGDRLVVVSPNGEIVLPDRFMIFFIRDILGRHPGEKILFDVKCSRAVPEAIRKSGGEPIMWKTGHSLIKAKLKSSGGIFAGEMSGHLFFKDRWPGFDDGIYSAARLCEILANSDMSTEELFAALPVFCSTPEIRVECENQHEFVKTLASQIDSGDGEVNELDGVRVDYKDGFGLVRASNTAPEIVLRFEADSDERLKEIRSVFGDLLADLGLDSSLVERVRG